MADIPINPVTRRVEFTGNTGTGPFAFTFNVLAQADIAVYKNNTLLSLTSDYTVSLNSNGTGSITLVAALIASDELVIIGDLPLSRTTDFVTAGDLLASSLNQQFDSNVVMSQQLDERFDRTIRSQPGDINKNLYLPLVSSRASQLLSFDSSGNITTTSLANVPDIGTVNLTVSGVASFADGSASAPSITNIGDTNTGMYFGAADQINFSIGGSEVISISSTGTTISGLSISSGDILLTDNSATALEIKEGSNNYLTFITTNGSEKLSFGSTANPTFEVNGSFRQPLIAATTSFFSQTYSGATLSATNGAVNIESYSASKAGIVLNGSGDQITFTSPTLGFVGLVQVVGAITTDTSLNIASSTTVDGILDEDDMASNSATKLATQQSIKAYVDAQVGTVDTLAEVLGNGNTTGANNIIVTAGQSITVDTISETTAANGVVIDGVTLKDGGATVTADVSFGDNDKAIFGAGSDLQIYHDGANSYIQSATGNFNIATANGAEFALTAVNNGAVTLFHDGNPKLATTSTGIDVTGTVTADGLIVDGAGVVGTFSSSNNNTVLRVKGNGATNGGAIGSTSSDDLVLLSGLTEKMRIDSSGRVGIGGVPNTNWRNDTADQEVLMLGTEATLFSDAGVTTELWNNAYVDNNDVFKNISTRGASRYFQYQGTHKWFTAASAAAGSNIGAEINSSPKMILDVSGNLLVGTTTLSTNTDGHELRADGKLVSSTSGAAVAYFNRNTSDGDIIRLDKDGTTVGSIKVASNRIALYCSTANSGGIRFSTASPSQPTAVPTDNTGADSDATQDLGLGAVRWKDLYLSGGVYLGGTGAANKLDDYEEGSYDVSIVMDSGTVTLASDYDGMKYTKIGRMVTVQGQIRVESVSNPSGLMKISLPFAIDQTSDEGRNISGCVPRLYQASVPSGGLYPYLTTVFNLGAYAQLEWVRDNATTINHVPAADEYYIIIFNYFTA